MIRPLTWYSQNVDQMPRPPWISKSPLKSTRLVTVVAGTNEVAMWVLQLYIGLFPNFHSPFREPKVSVFQTVFSHEISVPSPTSQQSLGCFSSWAPRVPFFSFHGQVRTHIVTFIKYMLISSILFRYCLLWVFGCYVCRYLPITHQHHPFRYKFSTGM